ncbi:MAG: M20 family metallo-hydrolase [Synergistaceae bacterium]|nr:M20 family metallo-hydrolase [Synergistaceae bacterium]
MKDKIFAEIDAMKDEMIATLSEMVAIPSINPTEGGTGEKARAEYLTEKIKKLGLGDAENYVCIDPDGNERPNLVVKIPGETAQRLWIVSHMDIVPPGELSLWESDPYKAELRGDKLYGRGTSDNGTSLVASIYTALAFKKLGIKPKYEICLCFVANEETGSMYGIQHLIKQDIFRPDDLVIVPDMTSTDGSFIEIAEKSIFWLEFTLEGKQTHASLPQLGNNAARAANEFSCALDHALHEAFPETNDVFNDPKYSTFEPTRRRENVGSINIVPGVETFAFDCRVLPGITIEEFEKVVNKEKTDAEKKFGVKISYKYMQKETAAPVTSPEAPVVKLLADAVQDVLGVQPQIAGVGGGTCGAFFRKIGIPSAVWGLGDEVAHMPNEYTKISDLIGSSKVLAHMLINK